MVLEADAEIQELMLASWRGKWLEVRLDPVPSGTYCVLVGYRSKAKAVETAAVRLVESDLQH